MKTAVMVDSDKWQMDLTCGGAVVVEERAQSVGFWIVRSSAKFGIEQLPIGPNMQHRAHTL